jgi:hypothetical protein
MLFSDFVFIKFNRVLLAVEHIRKDKFQTLVQSHMINSSRRHKLILKVSATEVYIIFILLVSNFKPSKQHKIISTRLEVDFENITSQ